MGKKEHANVKRPHGSIMNVEVAESMEQKRERLLEQADEGKTDKLEKLMEYINTEEEITKYKKYVQLAAKNKVLKAQYIMARDLGRFSPLKLSIYQKAAEAGLPGAEETFKKTKKKFRRDVLLLGVSNFILIWMAIFAAYFIFRK